MTCGSFPELQASSSDMDDSINLADINVPPVASLLKCSEDLLVTLDSLIIPIFECNPDVLCHRLAFASDLFRYENHALNEDRHARDIRHKDPQPHIRQAPRLRFKVHDDVVPAKPETRGRRSPYTPPECKEYCYNKGNDQATEQPLGDFRHLSGV